ncbi:MAG: V-type ATPase subunit, partial [Oscillospiraceae bacterium]|nr:V-type ATPase subunit [Oscillospiraceae bacterium]
MIIKKQIEVLVLLKYRSKPLLVPTKYIQNATVAKIRAAYGKRLNNEDYKALLAAKNLSDIVEYLKKNTHYAPIFDDVDPTSIHRGFVETLLHKYHFEKGVFWCNFQHLDTEPFYRYHIMFREIQEILNAIMYLNT